MNQLATYLVKLRAPEPDDIDVLMRWENDIDNWQLSGTVAPYSRQLLEQYLANAHLDIYQVGQLRFMIDEVAADQPVGTIDIFDFDPKNRRAGVGILIGEPQWRGKGLGKEALSLLQSYAFEHLGLKQLYCNILSGNKASLKLFEQAGFEVTGTKKAWTREGEDYKDELFLQHIKQ